VKILHVIQGLGTGGSERSLAELLPCLRDAGFTSIVVTLGPRPDGIERDVIAQGFDVRVLKKSRRLDAARAVRRVIQEERPDLVHTSIIEADLVGRFAAAGTGVPVVTSLVNTSYVESRLTDARVARWRLALARAVDAWSARALTDRFHAVSEAVRDASLDALGIDADRVRVVERGRAGARLGVPSAARTRAARRALGIDDDRAVLVQVGRQEHQKDQATLLRALRRVVDERPDTLLLVAGRAGKESPRLQALVDELSLDEHVRFLGHREDVPDVLACADLYVCTSLFEGIPGAVIEALGLGLPVVASDIAPLREVVRPGVTGTLVATGDDAAFARAIGALLDDDARRRAFSKSARADYEARFTIERAAARMIALFEDAARCAGAPRGSARGSGAPRGGARGAGASQGSARA